MDARARYDELVERTPGAEPAKMMGMPSVKHGGKLVAGFSEAEDAMTFKLPDPDEHASALALDGAHLFDPSGRGRPMKEWVLVPAAHADEWPRLLETTLKLAG